MFAHSYDERTLDEERERTVQIINKIIEREFVSLADVRSFDGNEFFHCNRIFFVFFYSIF